VKIDNDALLAAVDAAGESAYGSDSHTELSAERAKAIQAYYGENTNPAPIGRSQVVDRTVFEVVESMLPSLCRIFAGGDDVVKVIPVGPDDEEAADQTSKVLQWVVTEKNPWMQICHDLFKDALLLKNGYAFVYWDETEKVDHESYEGQSEEQIALLMQDDGVQVVGQNEYIDDKATQEAKQQHAQAMQQWQQMAMQAQAQAVQMGQPPQIPPPPQEPGPVMLYDVEIERTQKEGRVKVCVLPPEHCKVGIRTPSFTLDECDYFEFWDRLPISTLRAMGFDVDDDISDADDGVDDSAEDHARDRYSERLSEGDGADASMRLVKTRMVWIRADLEGKGIARLYYALIVGKTVLHVEPCSGHQVVSITPIPMPHRHVGMSEYDITRDIQDIKTAVQRGALDNLYLANNGRYVASDKVNLADLLESRPGGVIRLLPGAMPGDGHVMPIEHPFAFEKIMGAMSYFDQVKQNRSGMNNYFNGTDAGAMNKTARGVGMLTSQSAQRIEQIARMFSVGIQSIFEIALRLIQQHNNKRLTFQLNGSWVNVDPLAWSHKRDLKISVGVGAGNKEEMLMALNMQLQQQMALFPTGIVTKENLYATVAEMTKLQGFANSGKFYTDPKNAPPQPQQPPPEVLIEQQKAQTTLQTKQMELQADEQKTKQEMALEQWKTQQEMALKQWEVQFQAQVEAGLAQMQAGIETEAKDKELAHAEKIKGAELMQQHEEGQMKMQQEQMNVQQKAQQDAQSAEKLVGNMLEQFQQLGSALQDIVKMVQGRGVKGIERVRDPNGKLTGARVSRADGSTEEVRIQ
jgi:hypothetical protein